MPEPGAYENLNPREFKSRLDKGEKYRLIDVREQDEWDYCRLEGAEFMPMSQATAWAAKLAKDGGPYLVYCHHGVRSRNVCAFLAQQGVLGLYNLAGGIDRWSKEIDPKIPLY